MSDLKQRITEATEDPSLLSDPSYSDAVFKTLEQLDNGTLRVAEKINGDWVVHAWVKQAILLYFRVAKMEVMD